jgi:hypothetical protein
MKVKNLNGSTSSMSGSSWLALWEKLSGQTAIMCYAESCMKSPTVGGQVQKHSSSDTRWYVIPLCEDCNKKTGQDMVIWEAAKLVLASVPTTTTNFVTKEQFPGGDGGWARDPPTRRQADWFGCETGLG